MQIINLYPHQIKLIDDIKKELNNGNLHLVVQSPTGSGKTVTFSFIAQQAQLKNSKTLIITDRNELLNQTGSTIRNFYLNPSLIKAGTKIINRDKQTYIAMAQTLRNRVKESEWFDFIKNDINLVIIDEGHVQEFNYLFDNDLLEGKIVLSFTATPVRTGKMRQLGLDYDRIIRGASVKQLVKDGYLVNCDIYDCGSPDLSGVAMNYAKGDFSESAMFKKYDNPKLYNGLTKNYLRIVPDQKTLVFCCNIEHAIKTTIELVNSGISAKFVCSGKTPPKKPSSDDPAKWTIYNDRLKSYEFYKANFELHSEARDLIFEGFKNNSFKVLVNVDIATKGYDCPDIEVIVLYRATASLALYLQMKGRGARTSKGKTHFTVLDFGENKQRFGSYDDHREWSLWHEESVGGGIPPMKECGIDANGKGIKSSGEIEEGCKRLILAMYNICPFCGFKYPEKKEGEDIDLMLESIKDEHGVSIKLKPFRDMEIYELEKYREIKKHKMAWLWRQLWMNGGNDPYLLHVAQKELGWKKSTLSRAITYCVNNL